MTLIPDYRLAPAFTYPAAHQDSKKFVEWLLDSDYTEFFLKEIDHFYQHRFLQKIYRMIQKYHINLLVLIHWHRILME